MNRIRFMSDWLLCLAMTGIAIANAIRTASELDRIMPILAAVVWAFIVGVQTMKWSWWREYKTNAQRLVEFTETMKQLASKDMRN